MPASPYLLYANSKPTVVTDEIWSEWHVKEHLPDLVNAGAATKATLYQEIEPPFGGTTSNSRNFLGLCQTDLENCMETENYSKRRRTSDIFLQNGSSSDKVGDNGDFDVRNYELIQQFEQIQTGNVAGPYILSAEMQPQNIDDFEKWYREEHIPLLAKCPGYRRCLRYKLSSDDAKPAYLALHEVDDINLFGTEQAFKSVSTEWTNRIMADSKIFVARAWKLVASEG